MYANKLITHTYTCAQLTCTAATLSGALWCCRWMMDGVRVRTGDTREHPFISVTRLIPLSSHPLRHSASCQPPPSPQNPHPTLCVSRLLFPFSACLLSSMRSVYFSLSYSIPYTPTPHCQFLILTFLLRFFLWHTVDCILSHAEVSITNTCFKSFSYCQKFGHTLLFEGLERCPNLWLVLFVKVHNMALSWKCT